MGGFKQAPNGSGLWRFDGSSWQHIGAEWNVPDQPVAHIGFDRDGILWVLTGVRGPHSPRNCIFSRRASGDFEKSPTTFSSWGLRGTPTATS